MSRKRYKGIGILSGGMDSATMAYLLVKEMQYDVDFISFDYGQRHSTELHYAHRIADDLNANWERINLIELGCKLTGSALTDDGVDVPEGHYADETMKLTVVPNRNAIMISAAWGIAVARKAVLIGVGMHAGDHPVYPDCRPGFIDAIQHALKMGTQGFAEPNLELFGPFLHKSKADIVRVGTGLGVPYERTWSCYKGEAKHCGKCGTCVERIEAFELAGEDDPTEYVEAPVPA